LQNMWTESLAVTFANLVNTSYTTATIPEISNFSQRFTFLARTVF